MDFEDIKMVIFKFFEKEYEIWCNANTTNEFLTFAKFIKYKDLGIEYVRGFFRIHYRVIDEKKWMINRLKYGF